jgi:hypothetical protein
MNGKDKHEMTVTMADVASGTKEFITSAPMSLRLSHIATSTIIRGSS